MARVVFYSIDYRLRYYISQGKRCKSHDLQFNGCCKITSRLGLVVWRCRGGGLASLTGEPDWRACSPYYTTYLSTYLSRCVEKMD